jgi:hypothetical protein
MRSRPDAENSRFYKMVVRTSNHGMRIKRDPPQEAKRVKVISRGLVTSCSYLEQLCCVRFKGEYLSGTKAELGSAFVTNSNMHLEPAANPQKRIVGPNVIFKLFCAPRSK